MELVVRTVGKDSIANQTAIGVLSITSFTFFITKLINNFVSLFVLKTSP